MKISKQKFNELNKELEYRKSLRDELGKSYREALDQGDGIHDSFLIQEASHKINSNERKITDIEKILKNYSIANSNSDSVDIGSTITLKSPTKELKLKIVDEVEFSLDSEIKMVTINSSLGKKLLDSKLNSVIFISNEPYKITNIV